MIRIILVQLRDKSATERIKCAVGKLPAALQTRVQDKRLKEIKNYFDETVLLVFP